ncbi:MAG: leucine-rich repeat protein [Lachnospiraceae bacterium]|nr:leucine-rich repeat protein [Lachnospiraceae bacterium]
MPASNTISEAEDEISIPLSCTNAGSTDAYAYVTSSDPTVLSIENPHLRIASGAKVNATVRGKGTAVITATTFDSGSRATSTMKVENSMYAESVSLSETSLIMGAGGGAKKLNAIVSPSGASPKVVWSSTNESVATVNDNGVVTPVGGGSCRIIATSKDKPSVSASCNVIVLTAYCTLSIACKKDGEDWNDGTQPEFSFRHKESQIVYPSGGFVEAGKVELLADGQPTGEEYDVSDFPQFSYTYTVNYCTVKFVDADDTLLQTQFVLQLEKPVYSGPELGSEDEYCKVTHTGWSPRISYVYGATTYKATYTTTEKKHHWDEGTVTIEPGCETKGKKTYTCLVNSAHTKTEDIDPIGHKWDNGVVTTPATCESAGTKTFTCENDSSHTYTETIPATGHDWDNGVVTKELGCETKGVKTYTCNHDNSHKKTEEIAPKGHDWDEGVVTQEPGCITKGKKTFTCRHDDSHTRIEYIDALGHNMTGYQREEPTCTKPGKEAYWKCDRCEKLYLDAEGTTEVSEEALVIPATGHSMTEYAKISATCTKDGREAYCVCENCHKLFSDKTGSKEVTAASLVITATGHDWDEGVITTPATCETDGVKTFTCKNDGTHSYTQKITATGHDWTEWQITKEATEYESGTESRVCQNDASHIETRNIPPLGHTHVMEHVTAKPVSCEDDGCNEHYHCKSCGLDYSDEEGTVILNEENVVIRATGHSWDNGVETTPATCEEKGVRTYTCLNDGCGKTETEDIDPIGHLWDGGMETTPATCEEKGVWTYTCLHDGCGKTETEDINPIGHWWDGGVETTPASCEEKGVRTYTCLNDGCGKTKTEDIDPIGHWWDGGMETTHPTCETKGVLTFTCLNSGCGKTKTEDVAPYGHLWGEWFVSQYPTETENGIQTRYCQNDASHIEVKTIPATGSTSVINPEPGQGTFDGWDDDEDDWDEEDWDEAEELLGEIGYEILDEDEETVSFTGPDDLDVSSFSVPASVTVSGRTFAVTKIEDHAFSDCSNLTRVTIGKNVEEIGTGAFSGCSKLKTIIIPAKVKRIRPKAFFGCKNIRKITIKSTKLSAKTVGSKAFGNTRAKLIIKVPKKCKKAYKRFLKKKGNKTIIIK